MYRYVEKAGAYFYSSFNDRNDYFLHMFITSMTSFWGIFQLLIPFGFLVLSSIRGFPEYAFVLK